MKGSGKREKALQQLDLPFDQRPSSERYIPVALRVAEAARMVGLGRSKFYELIASGDIETVKVGRCTLVPLESLFSLIDRAREGKL